MFFFALVGLDFEFSVFLEGSEQFAKFHVSLYQLLLRHLRFLGKKRQRLLNILLLLFFSFLRALFY